MKEILNQANNSVEANRYEHPTVILATTFYKPVGEVNVYVHFGYGPLKICSQNQGQVLGLMNYYPINIIHTSQESTKEWFN